MGASVDRRLPDSDQPGDVELDPFNCPFIQTRWNAEGSTDAYRLYMEWMREGDRDWSESCRMNFYADWLEGRSEDMPVFMKVRFVGIFDLNFRAFCLESNLPPKNMAAFWSIF